MSYAVVIPARNEEKYLAKTLCSITEQTIKPKKIVVVNDGSNDNTELIALLYTPNVITLKDIGYSKLGMPILAEVFNKGFKKCQEYDFLFISGSDAIYPSFYISKLLHLMQKNSQLVMVSGYPEGEPINRTHVNGGGRLIRSSFFRTINFRYPVVHGWESVPIFEAWKQGKSVCSVPLVFYNQREGGKNFTSYYDWGRGMHTIGYATLIVWIRTIFFIRSKGIKSAIQLLSGYYSRIQTNCDPELKKFVRTLQIGLLWRTKICK